MFGCRLRILGTANSVERMISTRAQIWAQNMLLELVECLRQPNGLKGTFFKTWF